MTADHSNQTICFIAELIDLVDWERITPERRVEHIAKFLQTRREARMLLSKFGATRLTLDSARTMMEVGEVEEIGNLLIDPTSHFLFRFNRFGAIRAFYPDHLDERPGFKFFMK